MPQRFLRPGITNSERWNKIPFDAQSLYIRILTLVDDYGRYDGRPAVILGSCFSVWNDINRDSQVTLQQVERMLQQLAASPIILLYEADGKKVIQILQWAERVRENCVSKWPSPQVSAEVAASSCRIERDLLLPSSTPTPSPTPLDGLAEEAFKLFWKTYPRREGKSAAYKSFVRLKCYKIMDKIIPAIEAQKRTPQWTKDSGQFIPHPTTWLNQGRWDDEGVSAPIKVSAGGNF